MKIRTPPYTGVNSGAREQYAVPAYYKTPIMLYTHIYTVKFANSLVSYKRIENIYVKSNTSFEIWILCNGQPDCDDNCVIVVAMAST
jgi:hypothetical protein